MAWLAVADHQERRFSVRGLGHDKQSHALIGETGLSRGTILFETRLPAELRPKILFGFNRTEPAQRSLTFQGLPDGGIALVHVKGEAISHAELTPPNAGRSDVLRITYSWDTKLNWALLTLESLEEMEANTVRVKNPLPLSLGDIRDLILGHPGSTFSADLVFAGLSNNVEPVGPMPSLLPSTPISTPWGFQRIADLRRGDTVDTRDNGVVPVLQPIQQTLPAKGSFQPIRLRAPYFGLRQDVVVAPGQRLVIDGPEVEYLFGQEAVLMPARHLINGFSAELVPCGPTIRYNQLLLPRHESLLAAGTVLESFYLGRLRRHKERLNNSVIARMDRSLIPEHPQPVWPVLNWHDAIHLARRRAA